MIPISKIFVVWRLRKGEDRIIVASLNRESTNVTFIYDSNGVSLARNFGFNSYPEFPDITKIYNENVLEVISRRLISENRDDLTKYLNFWHVTKETDLFSKIGYTQAKLPTDNFEFLADFHYDKGIKFVTNVCGLTHNKIDKGLISVGDKLNYKYEDKNRYDNLAVGF